MSTQEHIPELRAALKHHGLKATPQRIAILAELRAHGNHPDVESIFEGLRSKQPSLSQATVYRTLESFSEAGIVRKFAGEDGKMRFDTDVSMHHHIITPTGEEIMDWHDEELNELIAEYLTKKGLPQLNVESFQLTIRAQPPKNFSTKP